MRWILILLLLATASTASAQHESERAYRIVRPDGSVVSGDDGSVAALYPCEGGALADSANRRVDLTWATGPDRWIAVVDTTMAYSFFYRTGCCSETLSVALQCVPLVGPSFVPGAIEYADLELNAAVNNMIASRVDSGVVVPDTLSATVLRAYSELVVQPGNPQALFRVDDASARLRNIGLDIDNGDFVIDDGDIEQQSGGNFSTLGTITAGFSASDAHDITGILNVTNDIDVNDDLDVENLAIIQDSLRLGTDLVAADSTKSSVRLHMWPEELPDQAWKTFTHTGTGTQNFKWIGVRSWDCVICSTKATSITITANEVAFTYAYTNGNISFTRPVAALGELTVICRWARGGD